MATKPKYKSDFQKELETHRKPNSTKVVKKEEPKKSNYSPRKTENRNRVGDIYSMFNDFTPKQQEEFLRQLEYSKARDSYAHYLKLCYPDMVFTYFHLYLCKLVEKVVEKIEKGENPRILLSVPPRHGKSMTITETLPSWFIGRNHNKGVILTAYNADLAEQFEDSNRQKTKNFGKQVFGVEVSEQQDNKTLYRLKGKRGGVIGVGINGGLTGNTGSWNLAIIDDPYKNGDEASSKNERDKKDRIFRDSILTRLSGKGSGVIVIMTRWHEEDMIGKLSKEKGWVYINIPCIAEKEDIFLKRVEGQTLCPELGFDSEWAIRTQEAVGKRVWNALYQGHPTTEGGNIVDRKYLKFYNDKSVPAKFDKFTQTWDLSFGDSKNSDPVAGQVWGKVGADHYLLKRINKRMDFNATYSMMKIISAQYPMAIKKIVERKANGQAIIDTLQNVVGGIVPFNPTDSKVSRLTSVLPLFVAGNIYLPDESIDPYINDFVEQLIEFPNGKHDDEVDAMTQYLIDDNNFNYGKINFEINEKFSNIRVGFGGKLKSVEGKKEVKSMIKLDVNLNELLNDESKLKKTVDLVLGIHFKQVNSRIGEGELSLKEKENFYNGVDINGQKLLVNKWKYIVDTSSDFFLGSSFDITSIGSKTDKNNILFLKEQLGARNFESELSSIAKSCSNYGNGFLMLYNEIGDTFPKFKKLNSLDTNVVYSCEVEEKPLFAFTIRTISKAEDGIQKDYYRIYVYFENFMTIFITPTNFSGKGFNCLYDFNFMNTIKETSNGFIPHDFKDIPIVEFRNNEEIKGDAECVYEAIMEYNKLKRDELLNIDDQINSLLVFKNVRLGDDDERTRVAEIIKRDKMLAIEGEGVDVKFVNNPLDFEKTQLVSKSLEEQIEHISRCSVLASEKFTQNASDPILKLKTKPMLDLAKSKEKIFTLSVRRVLEMIKDFGLTFGGKDRRKYEFNMSKLQLAYAHSLPSNDQDIITMIANLSNAGILNPEIALQQISWIENVDSYIEGMEEYTKQKLAIDKERALVKNNNKGENPANNGANEHNIALQNSIPQTLDQKDNKNAYNMGLANKLSEDDK